MGVPNSIIDENFGKFQKEFRGKLSIFDSGLHTCDCSIRVAVVLCPLHLVFTFIINQVGRHLLNAMKPYQGDNFSYKISLSTLNIVMCLAVTATASSNSLKENLKLC